MISEGLDLFFPYFYQNLCNKKYFYVKYVHVGCSFSLLLNRPVGHGCYIYRFSLFKFVCLICQLLQSYGQFVLVELIMQWVKFAMSQIFNARNVQWAKYSMSVLLVWPWWYQSQYATREHFWAEVPEKSFGTYVQYLSLKLQWRPLRMDLEAYLTIQYRSYLDKTAEYIEHFLLHILHIWF